jgi:hypothetical protein
MVKATEALAFHGTDGELRSAVRAARPHEIRSPARAAIKRKIFTHDSDRQRLAGRKLMGATDRLPEQPQISPRQRSRARMHEICQFHVSLRRVPLKSLKKSYHRGAEGAE